ncbi:hypothetical protein A5724_07360 [Mycobacterium sp. ACS1612]|uniref:hypothetical protein n=1 Tax=Mycobacterium sp. ACS1612 TaxID=1834117 RepID=UPI000800472A|nr:hypothetical protein [Mycobacterium sp. ACS1612]OBF40585.1 hypothetical protein A5724_07360 [Mycobacterium sp. ACS1612]
MKPGDLCGVGGVGRDREHPVGWIAMHERDQVGGEATADRDSVAVAQQLPGQPRAFFGAGVEYENNHVFIVSPPGVSAMCGTYDPQMN